jgi:hypothetical protein
MADSPGRRETLLDGLDGLDPIWGVNGAIRAYTDSTPQSASNPSNPSNSGAAVPAVDLLNLCRDLDIRLWAEGGRLRYDAPPDALDDGLRAEIVAHKAELLALVITADPAPGDDLSGPRRTAWGTHAWSAPDAPPLEAFGESPPAWEALSAQRWGPSRDHDEPPLDVPRDWRDEAAAWPHERWMRWRERAAGVLDGLDGEPTAEDIRAADRAAYDIIRAEGADP